MRRVDVEAEYMKRNTRIGEFIAALGYGPGVAGLEGGEVQKVTIRVQTEDRPDSLIVVKVCAGGEDYVGFVGGLTVADALLAWRAKDAKAGLKWKEDVPWERR